MTQSAIEQATGQRYAPSIDDWLTFPDAEDRSNGSVTANQLSWIHRNLHEERYKRYRRAFRRFGKSRRVCLSILGECLAEEEDA